MGGISPRERLAEALKGIDVPSAARTAGVTARQAANAIGGRPISTVAYLRLCMAMGHDPAPGHHLVVPNKPSDFDFAFFAMDFKIARGLKRHTDRQAAKAIEVAPATICRIELGHIMSIGVVLRACAYIGLSPFSYCDAPKVTVSRVAHTETLGNRS